VRTEIEKIGGGEREGVRLSDGPRRKRLGRGKIEKVKDRRGVRGAEHNVAEG